MTLRWLSTDLATSQVLLELPTLVPDWPLRRSIGQYESGTAHLYLDGVPKEWQRATLHGGSVLHCYDDTDPDETLQWSGIVLKRVRNATLDTIDLTLATGDVYLAGRYVGNKTYTGATQTSIVEDLISSYVADTGGVPFTVDATGGTATRDRTYYATDNATVYQRLQELMAVQGGPEWMVEWRWSDDREHIAPFLVVADRLGAAPLAGLSPAAAFTMPGCLVSATFTEDYTTGKGANKVTTYSTGDGDATPISDPQTASDLEGRPIWELRKSPSTSITQKSTLNAYAQQIVAQLAPGSNAVTLTAALAAKGTPVFGRDWRLGDTIYYEIGGLDGRGQETVLSAPGGLSGSIRALAHELTESTTTPIAATEDAA